MDFSLEHSYRRSMLSTMMRGLRATNWPFVLGLSPARHRITLYHQPSSISVIQMFRVPGQSGRILQHPFTGFGPEGQNGVQARWCSTHRLGNRIAQESDVCATVGMSQRIGRSGSHRGRAASRRGPAIAGHSTERAGDSILSASLTFSNDAKGRL